MPDETPSVPRRRIPVVILGSTGVVGRAIARMLDGHPWFELAGVGASERSVARPYVEAGRGGGELPASAAALVVRRCDPSSLMAPIVLSALDPATAAEVEPAYARAGALVVSNARPYRMCPDVPLLIPEVNPEHLEVVAEQRSRRGWPGAIVANGNCAAIVAALALAPLHRAFGVRQVMVTTLQAVSGAGYPGVASLDILGNIIPWIGGEEERIEAELPKMLGARDGGVIRSAPCTVSAQATRVPVEHGHTACIAASFDAPVEPREAVRVLREWRGMAAGLGLPSAPELPVRVSDAEDRPQPRLDAGAGGGMQVTVGRVRLDTVLDLRLVATGHNVVRGAAGAALLNAELLVARGMVEA